jgi:transcriptional regulator
MYLPPAFREDRIEVLHDVMRARPLATLVTAGAHGLMANHIPFLIDPAASDKGTLRAHLARANDQLVDLRAGADALVIFQGPDTYVTPSWYASKAEHGKVVPTWNYVAVHAWGAPRVYDAAAWLHRMVGELTTEHERPRAKPWAVDDAPEAYVAGQLRAIVGLEIPIARIEGKWKVSQNRVAADRRGVADGLRADGAAGEDMARLVSERGGPA